VSLEPILARIRSLSEALAAVPVPAGVAHVQDPLKYAWAGHEAYWRLAGGHPREVVWLGMNPGPFGMAQTGVPFGAIPVVRDWMGLRFEVDHPESGHPARPVEGLGCRRAEVSGMRLWGAIARNHPDPETFFARHMVLNYCPLLYLEAGGRNLTPDRLGRVDRERMEDLCDAALGDMLTLLEPDWVLGVGKYARQRLGHVRDRTGARWQVAECLHPSPASPAANRDWEGQVREQWRVQGLPGPCPV
jgi:single-strand selective monofunctional uracil DNA glycosylase